MEDLFLSYGPYGFGLFVVIVIWKIVVAPQLKIQEAQTETLRTTMETAKETARLNAETAKELARVSESLKEIGN